MGNIDLILIMVWCAGIILCNAIWQLSPYIMDSIKRGENNA